MKSVKIFVIMVCGYALMSCARDPYGSDPQTYTRYPQNNHAYMQNNRPAIVCDEYFDVGQGVGTFISEVIRSPLLLIPSPGSVLIPFEIYRTGKRQRCNAATIENAPVGTSVMWQEPQRQAYYTVTPVREYHYRQRYCREYQTIRSSGGYQQQMYSTACMQPDGSWEIMN